MALVAVASGTKGRSNGLEGEAQSAPAWTGRGGRSSYRPGLKELVVFAALVVLGLLVWFTGSPGVATRLFGVSLSPWVPADPLTFSFFTPVVCGVLALLAGFALPRGFYLWGIALNLHSPFAEALTFYLMKREGLELPGGTQGVVTYVVIPAVLFVFTVLFYTALSSIGMGARRLAMRITR